MYILCYNVYNLWITTFYRIVNVTLRYKASIPISAFSIKDRQGILISKTIT